MSTRKSGTRRKASAAQPQPQPQPQPQQPQQLPQQPQPQQPIMVPRPSSAGSLSKFEEALRFLEEVRGAFEPREDVEALEEAARNRQAARAALAACRADLRAATQRLARALGDAEARVRMLGDGAVAESELAELAARCADLERQARACGDAAERARGDWLQLDAEARAAEDSELRADVAHARTLPELRAVVMLLAAATNALFEADGTVCKVVDMELGDVRSVPLGAAPSVAEADALWAAIGATCHSTPDPDDCEGSGPEASVLG